MFISFEGIGGAGKTTQAELLRTMLERDGRNVVLTREPGGTDLGEQLRVLLPGSTEIVPWAEAALFVAARARLLEQVLAPAPRPGGRVRLRPHPDSSPVHPRV